MRALPRLVTTLLLSLVLLSHPAGSEHTSTYYACPSGCNAVTQYGVCENDGTCTCSTGRTGVDCSLVRAGLSLQKRRDDTYGYVYLTSAVTEGDARVADVARDPRKAGAVYAMVYDVNGNDAVVEISSIGDGVAGTPGWAATGPTRPAAAAQPLAMLPDATWCGTGISSSAAPCNRNHPGGESVVGWDAATQTAHGWREAGGFRDLVLDSTGSHSHVYAALNMWRDDLADPAASEPFDYQFRVFRWDGAAGTLASGASGGASYNYYSGDALPVTGGWILDAMAVNEADGTLVYKATPKDVDTKSRMGILNVVGGALVSVTTRELTPSKLLAQCIDGSCSNRRDTFRFNAAVYARVNGANVVMFVGSTPQKLITETFIRYYPSIFKVNMDTAMSSMGGIDGDEMYLDGGRMSQECEGQAAPAGTPQAQGSFSTFKSIAFNGQYGYAGTAAAGCTTPDCALRSGCIWMFSLDFTDTSIPINKVILSGGGAGGLGEMDVHRMSVLSDGTADGGYLYALTGASITAASRIVKIEIGGVDVTTACMTGCFRRVGSFLAANPVRAMMYAPELTTIFTASMTSTSTLYTRYSTSEVISLTPIYGPASGAATNITVTGSDFPIDTISASGGKSHAAACRFGETSTLDGKFPTGGWVPATVVSSTMLFCTAPAAAAASTTSTDGPTISGVAEIEVSFNGYPSSPPDSLGLFDSSLWSKSGVVYRYYTTPGVAGVLTDGAEPPAVMITGEAPSLVASIMTLRGGPFLNTGSLVCRFNGDPSSDRVATYVSATQIECTVCETHILFSTTRCKPLGLVSVDFYQRMSWLPDSNPRTVAVAFSLNGKDFHVARKTLAIFGQPHHLEVTHQRTPGKYTYPSGVTSDGFMTLDPMEMKMADVNGYLMQNEFGRARSPGFTVEISLNATSSPVNSNPAAALTEASSGLGVLTSQGVVTLSPSFTRALVRGDYHLIFKLQDCTTGTCVDMAGITTLVITVMPGVATQILVRPGFVSSISAALAEDAIIVPASTTVELGVIFVDVLDAGANLIGGIDGLTHVINVSSTTNQLQVNGGSKFESRATGATFTGNMSMTTMNGIAEFRDLKLVSQTQSGKRVPGMTSTLTFGSPSRGVSGVDELYNLQFSSQLPGLAVDVQAFAISKLKITPGLSVYLKIADYADVTVACNDPEESISLQMMVNIFDGGNNLLLASEPRTVTVQSYGIPRLNVTGTTAITHETGTAAWYFPPFTIRVTSKTVGSYGMQFTSPAVTSIVQVVNMVKGTRGYRWRAVQIGQWTNLPSSISVSIGSFRMEVLDGAGNKMGIDDRYGVQIGFTVNRLVRCSSATVTLSGVTEAVTSGSGVANFTGLSMTRPAVGSHVIRCVEYENVINRDPPLIVNEDSENTFVLLVVSEFIVTVVTGAREALQVQVVTPNTDPKVDYSVSFGDVNTHTFRRYASADRIVPLDTFRVRPVDAGANPLSGVLPAFNASTTSRMYGPVKDGVTVTARPEGTPPLIVVEVRTSITYPPVQMGVMTMPTATSYQLLFRNVTQWTVMNSTHVEAYNMTEHYTVTTVTQTRRFVSALLTGVSTTGLYPYTTGHNVRLSRSAVLIGNVLRSQTTADAGTTVEMLGDSNEASMAALALRMPPHGSFDLNFTTIPLDPQLAFDSIRITVQPGRAHHIGLAAPCMDTYPLVACGASSTLDGSGFGLPCTCAVYNVSDVVPLSPLHAYILDGGENALGSAHTPVCATACTGQTLTLLHDPSSSGLCVLKEIVIPDPDPSTAPTPVGAAPVAPVQPECAVAQPSIFTGVTFAGAYTFTNLALVAPTQAIPSKPMLLTINSPGLIGVSFGLEIRPGVAVKLRLVLVPNFLSIFQSDFVTLISNPAQPIIVQVLDAGGSPLGESDTQSRQVLVTCATATLGPFPGGMGSAGAADSVSTQRDIAYFGSIRLLSPPTGTHTVIFSTPDLISISLNITVVIGAPVQLRITTVTGRTYAAEPVVTIKPITMRVFDAGSNYVGAANYIAKPVFANITGGPVNADGTPAYAQVTEGGENMKLLQLGVGEVTFDTIKVRGPLAGTYNITFGGDGITGDAGSFTIEVGAPYKLNVPAKHTLGGDPYPMFNNREFTLRTTYASERSVQMRAFAVIVMDGGNNFIGGLDVDQLGAGMRRDLTATVTGDLMQPLPAPGEMPKKLMVTSGGATAVGVGEISTRYTASVRRSATGEGVIDDLALYDPGAGAYTVTVSSQGLVPYVFQVTVTQGYPSSLDACGCPTCTRRMSDGVCVDSRPYPADVTVSLRDALVVMRDAGGALLGPTWDAGQTRNITGELIYGKSQASGVEITYMLNSGSDESDEDEDEDEDGSDEDRSDEDGSDEDDPDNKIFQMTVLSNFSRTYLTVREGMVAWCTNGTRANPVPRFCRPADLVSEQSLETATVEYLREQRRIGVPEPAPVTGTIGEGLEYYGVRAAPRWEGTTHGLNLDLPYSGVYRFRFASFCPSDGCSVAVYRELLLDELEITVIPGTPYRLEFSQSPPARFENDFAIDPAVQIRTLDIAGNLCTNLDTFAAATVTPLERRIHDQIVPVIGGIATFPALRVQGNRGTTYTLRFDIVTVGLSIQHSPFLIIPCEEVKPNSRNDGDGQCECAPGYTADIRSSDASGTGFTDDVRNVLSYPDLYRTVVYRPENYLRALNPYGLCVPCANGFYKPLAGGHNCTRCPFQMDTSWENGQPRDTWTTLSGEARPGQLGNHRMDSCHCIVRRQASGGKAPLETYRVRPLETFRCELCPTGGICNGLPRHRIVIDPGRWRANTNMTVIYDCLNKDACLGGEKSECAEGYVGNLCAVCVEGYAQPTLGGTSPPSCAKCTSNVGGLVLFAQLIVQGVVVMTIFRVASRERNGSVGLFKTLLTHFQMMYLLFQIADKVSTPSIRSFEVDCLLEWNHYQYTGYYCAIPAAIAAFSIVCYAVIRAKNITRRKNDFFQKKFKLQEKVATARRNGKETAEIQAALDEMKVTPNFVALSLGAAATMRMGEQWETEDGSIARGPTEEQVAEMPATAYDLAFCFSLIMLYFSWITIIKHLLQLIRSRTFAGAGSFLLSDLRISVTTPLYSGWLFGLGTFLAAYLIAMPYTVFQSLRGDSDRLHWQSVKNRLGFLFQGLQPQYYWWEFAVMARKLSLVAAIAAHLMCDPFYSSRQQSLETVSLTVTLVAYHVGILLKAGGDNARSDGAQTVFFLLQFTLNAGVLWRFSICIFKDLTLASDVAHS